MENLPKDVAVQRYQQEARSNSDRTYGIGQPSAESALAVGFSSAGETTSASSSRRSGGPPLGFARETASLRSIGSHMNAPTQALNPPVQLIDPPRQTPDNARSLLGRRNTPEDNPRSSSKTSNNKSNNSNDNRLNALLNAVKYFIQHEMQGSTDPALVHLNTSSPTNNLCAQETFRGLNGKAKTPPPTLSTEQPILGNVQSNPRIGLPSSFTTFAESQKQQIQSSIALKAKKECTETADSILSLKNQVETLHGDCGDYKNTIQRQRYELDSVQFQQLQQQLANDPLQRHLRQSAHYIPKDDDSITGIAQTMSRIQTCGTNDHRTVSQHATTSSPSTQPAVASKGPGLEPTDLDVLLGRGSRTNNHVGTRNLRTCIRAHLDTHGSLENNVAKSAASLKIVDRIRSEGGRFVEMGQGGVWYEVCPRKAHARVSQMFRTEKKARLKKLKKAPVVN